MGRAQVLVLFVLVIILAAVYFGINGSIFGNVVQLDIEQIEQEDIGIGLIELKDIEIKRGQGEFVSLQIVNSGERFLNFCKLSSEGTFDAWIGGDQVESLSPGEKVDFVFALNVPFDVESGKYEGDLLIKCDEVVARVPFDVEVVEGDFELIVLNYERIGINYKIDYSVKDLLGKDQEVEIVYSLENLNGQVIEGVKRIELTGFEKKEGDFEFTLPKSAFGEFELSLKVSNGFYVQEFNKKIFLSEEGITGFAISESNKKSLSFFGIVSLILVLLFFVLKFIYRDHHKGSLNRGFIKINLEESDGKTFL